MRARLLLLAVVTTFARASTLNAQAALAPAGVTTSMSPRETPNIHEITAYAISETEIGVGCDDSGFRAIEGRKTLGGTLQWTGAVVAAGGFFALQSGSVTGLSLISGGTIAAIAGWVIKSGADDTGAMDKAIQSLTIGQTRSADVLACMGRPMVQTTKSSAEETWTYNVTKLSPRGGMIGLLSPVSTGGTADIRSVTLTFKGGLLTDISKTASNF